MHTNASRRSPARAAAILAVTTLAAVGSPSALSAEPPPAAETSESRERPNSINLSPLGVLIGSYSLNYERLFGAHGLLLESSFFALDDDGAESSGLGLGLGYRWHTNGTQNSFFLGANVGASVGSGDAELDSGGGTKMFEVDVTTLFAVANVGRRFAWDSGLNITLRLGAGYGYYDITSESTDPDVKQAIKKVDDLLTAIPVAIDGELSLGYTF